MSRVITVPAAGVRQQFGFAGRSIYVVQSASYEEIADTPQIEFDTSGTRYPGITRSRYGNPAGKFNSIFITGTEESAGDELTLLSLDVCVDDFINFDALATTRATLKASFEIVLSDAVEQLTQVQLTNSEGKLPSKMYITPNGGNIRYAFDADPEQGVGGFGHVVDTGDLQPITGINFITAFRVINRTNATPVNLTITLEY